MSSLIDVHITFLQQQTSCQGRGVIPIVSCQTAVIKHLTWLQLPPLLISQQCCAAIKAIKGKSTWLLLISDDLFLLSQLISAKCSGMGRCVGVSQSCAALLFWVFSRVGQVKVGVPGSRWAHPQPGFKHLSSRLFAVVVVVVFTG